MRRKWRNTVLVVGLGLYLTGLGFAGGVAADRIWYSRQRLEVLHRYDNEVQKLHAYLMRLELRASAARDGSADGKAEVQR